MGPFVSGGLYTIAEDLYPHGEALPFGLFGGIAFLGFLAAFGIRSANLEDEGASEEEDTDNDDEDSESGTGSGSDEEGRRLLS